MSPSVETQIAAFLDRYTPAMAAQLGAARQRLRALFPRGHELVFDNWNALVFGISPGGRTSDAFISVAGYPKWTTLFFLHGATLDDPHRLLEGDGKQVRGVRLAGPQDFDRPELAALIAQAVAPHRAALDAAPPLATEIRLVAQKQRPRRPKEG